MSQPLHPRVLTGMRYVAPAAGAAVVLIGGLVLLGWAFDLEHLRGVIPGAVAMNPGGTALAFLLLGAALIIQSLPAARGLRPAAYACAAVVVLIALLRLAGYLFEWDGGPDQLLFRQQLDREAARTGHANRMAPNTAAGLLLL